MITFRTRNNFTTQTKRDAHTRSGGICECHLIPHVFKVACGCALGPGNTFYEHIDPDAISSRSDLNNCAVLTKTCWSLKTNRHDKPVVAKSNRVRDRANGIHSTVNRPLPFGLGDRFKKRMDGKVVLRSTNQPWRPGQ